MCFSSVSISGSLASRVLRSLHISISGFRYIHRLKLLSRLVIIALGMLSLGPSDLHEYISVPLLKPILVYSGFWFALVSRLFVS